MNNKAQISEERLRKILEENINLKIENAKLEEQLTVIEEEAGIKRIRNNKKLERKIKKMDQKNSKENLIYEIFKLEEQVKKLKKAVNKKDTINNKLREKSSNLKNQVKRLKKENKELKQNEVKIIRSRKNPTNNNKNNCKDEKKNLKEKLYNLAYAVTTKKEKINETETIKSYVSKLFKNLNYDYTHTTFKSEYQLTKDNKNRVDLFYNESKNKNFICECKKLNTNFNSIRGGEDNGETPIEQIRRYLKNTNETNVGILTDGLKIQIHLKNLYTGELFNKYYDINLNHLEDNDLEILKDLSRKNFNVEKFINKYGQ